MTTYILGAGPAGMAVADGLIDEEIDDFVVLERNKQLGGLAQTINWQDAGLHDLGPHKIFTLDKNLELRIENLLPKDDWLKRDKISSIFMNGEYLPYPPSPFSLAGIFGLNAFIKMIIGYGQSTLHQIFFKHRPKTFEEDLKGRLGAPLYEILFKPIAQKLWGDPTKLDIKLSQGRIQTPSIIEVIGRLLKLKKESEFEALTFRYPKKGLGRLWKSIESKAKSKSQFQLNSTITSISIEQDQISAIHYDCNGVSQVAKIGPDDFVASTLPLTLMVQLLGKSLPSHFQSLAENVVALNDLLLVFFHIDKERLTDDSWIFVPDPEIIFHRLSEQESFDPSMTPNGSIICCEVMSSPDREFINKTDDVLYAEVEKGLAKMGFNDHKILKRKVIRLTKSYPVFYSGFEKGLAELIEGLDKIKNLRSIGRQGAFNYIGTLDAMDIGYGFANWLVQGRSTDWKNERKRTSHYPVLD